MKTLKFIFFTFFLAFCYSQVRANLSKDWISYFGNGYTKIYDIKYDSLSNHIYITGTTSEVDRGTPGVHQPNLNNTSSNPLENLDAYIAKFTVSGNLVWFTYFGGNKMERSPRIALDKLGNIYLTGYTESTSGIASPGAFMGSMTQVGADFIAKFDPQGQRLWATYYNQRSWFTYSWSIPAVDENNNVYILGLTKNTTGIATAGAFQTDLLHHIDSTNNRNAYLVKFSPGGQRIWGTYFGGGEESLSGDIQIDRQNNVYITGRTSSKTNIASPGAMVGTSNNNTSYLARFNENGQRIWSTYIHNDSSHVSSIAIDANANVYVFGTTTFDYGIATPGAWQTSRSGGKDFFLMKLNSSGHKVWGTYYGGGTQEFELFISNIGVDMNFTKNRIRLSHSVNPEIYVSGISNSATGLQKGCTIPSDTTYGAVFSKFDANGQLLWGSRYEGHIFDFDLGRNDSMYFVGHTSRANMASANAYQTNISGSETGLFGKFVEHFVCPTDVTIPFSRVNDSLIAPAGYSNYQWFRNDTLLQNGPQNYFILQGYYEGVYKLKVLDPCNCIFDSDTLFVEHPTSLKGASRNTLELSVAPNPAANKISVQLKNAGQHEYRFRIYNILGRKIFESDSKFDTGHKKVIDLSNYAPGVYLLHVENSTGKAIMKFIRQ